MKIIHCSLTCKNNINGLCNLNKITINIDGCLCWEEEKLIIGTYEDNMFYWNLDFNYDFLDNPDFAESLDDRFVHDETGLYFLGTEQEYHEVIKNAIIEFDKLNNSNL